MNNIIFKMKFMIITKKMNNIFLEKEKKRRKIKTFFQCENQKNRTFLVEKRGKMKEREEWKEEDIVKGETTYLAL